MNDVSILLNLIQSTLVARCPKDTRNLMRNGIVLNEESITIGNEQVPYAYFTNMKRKNNPNQGWVDKTVIQQVKVFGAKYGYEVEIK